MTIVANKVLTVKSPSFADKTAIPKRYTCEGENISPELNISGLPENTKSIAVVMEDLDANSYVHWLMWDIPVVEKITENSSQGTCGINNRQESKYYGPCPPSGTHHYLIGVYALDTKLNLPSSTNKPGLLKAIEGHILAAGELVGLYGKFTEVV